MSAPENTSESAPKNDAQSTQTEERKSYGNNASADFLGNLRGHEVIVKQNSGIEYRGSLQAVDGFLNVVLRDTKEAYNGKQVSELGEVFLRGSSVEYIAAA